MSPWGAGYKDFCIFVFSPFRKIFRCFNFLGGYWIFWWPRLDSLKDGIMFAESGVANGRMRTPFKKNQFFFLPFLPRWLDEEYRANASTYSARNPASSGFEYKFEYRYININIYIYVYRIYFLLVFIYFY